MSLNVSHWPGNYQPLSVVRWSHDPGLFPYSSSSILQADPCLVFIAAWNGLGEVEVVSPDI